MRVQMITTFTGIMDMNRALCDKVARLSRDLMDVKSMVSPTTEAELVGVPAGFLDLEDPPHTDFAGERFRASDL